MIALRIDRVKLVVVLTCFMVLGLASTSFGQAERLPGTTEHTLDVDVEVQLHLIVASNSGDTAKLPPSIDAVAKQLRANLPFTNFRLGATFLSRVKNGRAISVKGVGRTLLVTPALESSVLPTFYEFSASTLTLKADDANHPSIEISGFRFGLRIPLQTGPVQGKVGAENSAGVLYESVGITTDVSIREGEPVVIGTLDVGRPNESLVLVLVVRQASAR